MSLMALFCSPLHLLICLFVHIQYVLVSSLFPFVAQNAVVQDESSAADGIKVCYAIIDSHNDDLLSYTAVHTCSP